MQTFTNPIGVIGNIDKPPPHSSVLVRAEVIIYKRKNCKEKKAIDREKK